MFCGLKKVRGGKKTDVGRAYLARRGRDIRGPLVPDVGGVIFIFVNKFSIDFAPGTPGWTVHSRKSKGF